MDGINLLQTIINGGPALLLAIAVVMLWRTWRSDIKNKNEDVAKAQNKLAIAQEQRVSDAQDWSSKYNDLATQVHDSMVASERFMGIVERTITSGGSDGVA